MSFLTAWGKSIVCNYQSHTQDSHKHLRWSSLTIVAKHYVL